MAKAARSDPAEEKPPKKKLGIDADELEEFEAYFRAHEKDSSPYHVNLALQAGTGLILIEILRTLRKA